MLMSEELKKSINLIRDISLKESLLKVDKSYDRILKLTGGDIQEYPNVKKLKMRFIPELARVTERYASIHEDEDDAQNSNLREELGELLYWTARACETVLKELQEAISVDVSIDIAVLQTLIIGSGLTGSDFEIEDPYANQHIRNAAGKALKNDPFEKKDYIQAGIGKDQLKEGYKPIFDLQYEYLDDYYPIRAINQSKFSNIIDDLQSGVDKAKDAICSMLKPILKSGIICVVPDIGYESLIDCVKQLSKESDVELAQVVGIDFEKGIYVFNGKANILKKEIILLGSVCTSGDNFNKCRHVLFESGAAVVRCVALGREVDYIPKKNRRKK